MQEVFFTLSALKSTQFGGLLAHEGSKSGHPCYTKIGYHILKSAENCKNPYLFETSLQWSLSFNKEVIIISMAPSMSLSKYKKNIWPYYIGLELKLVKPNDIF